MFNNINKDVINFRSLKDAESAFGDTMSIDERYPKSFTFAGYADLDDGSIVVGTSFQDVINQGVNETFAIEEFPYTVISNLNANPVRWGYFVNESFKRIYSCMQSVNYYINNTRSATDTNNAEINEKFKKISNSIDYVNYSYLESNRIPNIKHIPSKNNKTNIMKDSKFIQEDISEENQKIIFTIMDYIPNEDSVYKLKDNIVKTVNIKDGSITPEKIGYGIHREQDTESMIKHTKALLVNDEEIQTWVKEYEENITSERHAVSHKFLEERISLYPKNLDINFSHIDSEKALNGKTNKIFNVNYIVSDTNTITELENIINKANGRLDINIVSDKKDNLTLHLETLSIRRLTNLDIDTLEIASDFINKIIIDNCIVNKIKVTSPIDLIVGDSCSVETIELLSDSINIQTDIKTNIILNIDKKTDLSNSLILNVNNATIQLVEQEGKIDDISILYSNNIKINN